MFIGFAAEETGLLGSKAYMKSLPRESRSAVHAMVNLECLGLALPKVFLGWPRGSMRTSRDYDSLDHRANAGILHSPRDSLTPIHPSGYYQSYKLAAVYLTYLDSALP